MIQIGQIILFKVSSNPMTQSQMFFRNLPVAALKFKASALISKSAYSCQSFDRITFFNRMI
jgi:hypothetical protein